MGSFNPPVSTFLSANDREKWRADKVPFVIVGAELDNDGKFGKCIVYKLARTDAKTGEVETRFLSLSSNPRRREEAEYISQQLIEDSSGVGPCRLEQVATDNGNPAWIFVSAE
jgi:hypothetical protein